MKAHSLQMDLITLRSMLAIYCRTKHGNIKTLCKDCQEMLDYAQAKLTKCPYKTNKPTCAKCKIHCYEPEKREMIRKVMKFSGPRMLFRHPILAIRHLIQTVASKKK